jgi:hypothetical protein
MHDVSMSGASGHGEEPMASMRDAQGELAARQIHLPNIRDDRKSVDRHKQIGLRYGSRCQPVRAPPDDKPRTAFYRIRGSSRGPTPDFGAIMRAVREGIRRCCWQEIIDRAVEQESRIASQSCRRRASTSCRSIASTPASSTCSACRSTTRGSTQFAPYENHS